MSSILKFFRQPRFRRILALAVLVGGIGWSVHRFMVARSGDRAQLEIQLEKGISPAGVEIWLCIRGEDGEDAWSFRGRLRADRTRFSPQVAPGAYEMHAEVHVDGVKHAPVQRNLQFPGARVRVQVLRDETRILR